MALHKPNNPPEAQAAHEPPAPQRESKSNVLMEGTGGIRVVRFTLNGQVKSLNLPVSGADLYRLSGGAKKLTVGGHAVANDGEPIDLADDAEVTAAY